MSDERDPEMEEGRALGSTPEPQPADVDDTRPLTGEPAATMRLRAEPPRVTRLSRKVLAGLGLAASLGVGGALIYALQTRHGGQGQELYSTDNRSTPDGLAGLPSDPQCAEWRPRAADRRTADRPRGTKPRGTTPGPGAGGCADRTAVRLDRESARQCRDHMARTTASATTSGAWNGPTRLVA